MSLAGPRGAVACAFIAGLAIAPVTAVAGTPGPTVSLGSSHGYEYLKASMANVVSQAGVGVLCDGDADPIGGGGTIGGSDATAALNGSSAFSGPPGDGWQAYGSSTTPQKLTTYAICAPEEISWSQFPFPISAAGSSGDFLELNGDCTDRRILVGIQGDGGNVRISTNRPVGQFAWISSTQNYGNSAGTVFQSYTCLESSDPTIRMEAAPVVSGATGKVTAKCNASEAVIDGGFALTQGGSTDVRNMWATSLRPYDSKDKRRTPDDGWTVKARNIDPAKAKLTAYAFCE